MAAITGSAAGHPNIRATHRKTLELTRDAAITERATCVVGVAAELPEDELAALHGRVALTLSVGDQAVEVRGRLNPAFRPGDPLVVRRAPDVTRNAVIVGADVAAAEVPRSFVTAAASPSARIAVRVEELGHEACPGVLVVHVSKEMHHIGAQDVTRVSAALARGERVEVDVGAGSAIVAAHAAGHTVLPAETGPLSDAVLVAAGLTEARRIDGSGIRASEGDLELPALIEGAPADRVPKWLRKAARAGASRGVVGLDLGTPREQYLPWRAGERLEIQGARGRTATLALVQD
jgi:hypothetical protein